MADTDTLQVGDGFTMLGVKVEVLRDREPARDIFGRDVYRYWCKREDTGAEGYCTFGPGGVVND